MLQAEGWEGSRNPSILWDGVFVFRRAVHFHREASCRDGGGPGWCGQMGKQVGSQRGIGKMGFSGLHAVCWGN